ncbi:MULTISPECIES: ABC transporter ATP-binding protein [Methylosinus]|uniref:ABC transporter ATP-binding protein n=1 Tax=Methylosinus trichosporium (strain ATCC 35070 / NCIMB 11131 / UNIQEM 75 / OB3b) TaxID=595536 RepID=A0A2D2D2J5_METT3|nr:MULTISPECIES: ATP-binding cassette domain-containing protein [Methylosinus]ATQ69198.1 ABC transporter ATP-binding protein [Methylosinus trichosporium OB3b]OBS53620.1 ABC transporter ATP-binding protein [Methylosinus sp. 3S-1]
MSHDGAAALLEVRVTSKDHVTAGGRPQRVLQDLQFTLPMGRAGAVVGPSGCGKTTLLRLIAGLDAQYEGAIRLPAGGRLGMVFQEPRLLPWRSVVDNLRIAAPQAREETIAALLMRLGLAEHAGHFPGELSLGLARRVALARALAIEPDLLLMDEPFVSLDAMLARELRGEIAALIDERRVTTLIVTHDIREAIELADRVFLLSTRPARVFTTLEIATPRRALTKAAADALQSEAEAAIEAMRAHGGMRA